MFRTAIFTILVIAWILLAWILSGTAAHVYKCHNDPLDLPQEYLGMKIKTYILPVEPNKARLLNNQLEIKVSDIEGNVKFAHAVRNDDSFHAFISPRGVIVRARYNSLRDVLIMSDYMSWVSPETFLMTIESNII